MNSVPIEIMQLGLDISDYIAIGTNVKRVLNMKENWDSILKRANSELPKKVLDISTKLPGVMAEDKEFFKEANLNYANGVPVQGCFTVAVADYLLRNRDKIRV
ncbi:MAG: hypothetical protein ABIF18_03865 [archaeon]